MATPRNSSFELIRLFAQFFIVFYHMLTFLGGAQYVNSDALSRAIWIPLHIGVPIFVMISGFFGIHPSLRGLLKLVITVAIYFIPLHLVRCYIDGGGKIGDFLIISNCRYWFVRTYIYLYLFSPVLNLFVSRANKKQFAYLLLVLLFINVYVGLIGNDSSLQDGKNLANFSLLYVLGAFLHRTSNIWGQIKIKWLLISFIILNFLECTAWIVTKDYGIGIYIWKICFHYNGLLLMVCSMFFICSIANLKIQSSIINRIARSSFAIYLIHCHGLFVYNLHVPVVQYLSDTVGASDLLLLSLFGYAIIVFLICIIIDQMLMPLWNWIGIKLQMLSPLIWR